MSKMSDYLEVQLRKHLFRTGSFTKPTELWVSLHTADPADTGAGAEVAGGSYGRVQNDPADANWTAPDATGGVTRNAVALTFPAPTADWGDVTYFAIWDDETAGNLITFGPLDDPVTILDGQQAPVFPIGSIVLTFA